MSAHENGRNGSRGGSGRRLAELLQRSRRGAVAASARWRRSAVRLLDLIARRREAIGTVVPGSKGFMAFRFSLVLGVLAFGFLSAKLLLGTAPLREDARTWSALGAAIGRHENRIVAIAIEDPRLLAPDAETAWRDSLARLIAEAGPQLAEAGVSIPVEIRQASAPVVLGFLDEAREAVHRRDALAAAQLERRWAELYTLVVASLALSIVALFLLDRNARARVRMAELDRRATRDPLTGVLNRRALLEYGEREVPRCARRGEPMALMLLDIDRFKAVNDGYGHAAGDRLVQEVASRLGQLVRPYDALGRWGGDEFLVVLPGCDRAGAAHVAERVVERMHEEMSEVAPGFRTSVSVGVAVATVPFCSLAEMIDAADAALYRSKAAGRDSWTIADAGPRVLAAGPAPERDELHFDRR